MSTEEIDQKHFPTESTAKSERAKHVLATRQAAAGGASHGHLSSGLEPTRNPVAHFLHGRTSLRVSQASVAWAWALTSSHPTEGAYGRGICYFK